MEKLIPIINRLQDVLGNVGQSTLLDLPQIVVIGSQSSGKSSVLESILGKSFLPRASGICTRRPLVLQLYQNNENTEEWAEFLHIPNRRFVDFEHVRREIEIETDRETGRNKGISSKAIRLKVFSPHVLNLTLVDLPGITKVPVGDQPVNVEDLTREMCLEYISNPLSIILAVSPANADLANSDALKLSRAVDPAGDRTIGILTKLDLMDDGVDALDALTGEIIPLKRGYVGIVNRSQAELNANISAKEIRSKERAFFLNHPSYRSIASRQGTEYLSKSLNSILFHHIRDHLPDIKASVQKQLHEVENELAMLGNDEVDVDDPTAQGQLILALISRYCNAFVDSLEGRQPQSLSQLNSEGSSHTTYLQSGGLYGGARLSRAFQTFSDHLLAVSPFYDLSDEQISMAITNATGPRPALFVPELSFEILVKRQLSHLQAPAIHCALEVFEVLQEVADQSCFAGLTRFRSLQEHVCETVNSMLSSSLGPTQTMLENLIKVEKAFINTNHPDFTSRLQMIRNACVYSGYGCTNLNSDSLGYPGRNNANSSSTGFSVMPDSVSSTNRGRVASTNTDSLDSQVETVENIQNVANGRVNSDSVNGSNEDDIDSNGIKDDKKGASTGRNFMSFIFSERFTTDRTGTSNPNGVKKTGGNNSLPPFPERAFSVPIDGVYSSSPGQLMPLASTLGSLVHPKISQETHFNSNEADVQISIIKRLIESYLFISRKNILDLTPKTIMHFLVNEIKEKIHTELIRALYREKMFPKLLQESDEAADTRKNCHKTAQVLNHALVILNGVREFKLM